VERRGEGGYSPPRMSHSGQDPIRNPCPRHSSPGTFFCRPRKTGPRGLRKRSIASPRLGEWVRPNDLVRVRDGEKWRNRRTGNWELVWKRIQTFKVKLSSATPFSSLPLLFLSSLALRK
jgi:hypothetical protein